MPIVGGRLSQYCPSRVQLKMREAWARWTRSGWSRALAAHAYFLAEDEARERTFHHSMPHLQLYQLKRYIVDSPPSLLCPP